jgi:hypothetical protein
MKLNVTLRARGRGGAGKPSGAPVRLGGYGGAGKDPRAPSGRGLPPLFRSGPPPLLP